MTDPVRVAAQALLDAYDHDQSSISTRLMTRFDRLREALAVEPEYEYRVMGRDHDFDEDASPHVLLKCGNAATARMVAARRWGTKGRDYDTAWPERRVIGGWEAMGDA